MGVVVDHVLKETRSKDLWRKGREVGFFDTGVCFDMKRIPMSPVLCRVQELQRLDTASVLRNFILHLERLDIFHVKLILGLFCFCFFLFNLVASMLDG